MLKLDGLSIPMIMGDWRLIIEALEEKLQKNIAIDLDTVSEDEAADICEDIDRVEGVLAYVQSEYKKEYNQ
ncbi:hypothetical protein NDQ71_24285 (plasmid) [Pseudoalteromonas sp. KG3]|jgi:hypothetical protein|uniref:Uncharacterized protein n=1 Tax=Pseudoalteromonas arctica TaxID=394751 RepID=A0A7Y0DW84_9GAMM|nr:MULTISPECIES: hypothetical protein [Pseudoalteromonas]NMM42764.1 hypothetical protein [Pseudoalteromonas arctica]WKD26480.1 hypothetical protein NDQ71_24285 [Pseudoalteromonas sp. KG3]